MTATARVVTRGGAQSVHLPRQFRLRGKTVNVRRTTQGLLLSPEKPRDPEKLRKAFAKLAGSCPDLPEVPPHTTPDLRRKRCVSERLS